MGVIDTNAPIGIGYVIVFAILACFFVGTSILIWHVTHKQTHYAQSIVLAYVFPLCPIILAMDAILLSIAASSPTKRFLVVMDNDSPLSTLGNVIGPCAIPILLDVLYEVCYLVHKRRSVNFFGLEFDQGHRVKILSSTTRSFVLRNFIRVLALALFAIGILANFEIVVPTTPAAAMADGNHQNVTRSGWLGLFPWTGQIWLLFKLIPSLCLFVLTFFLSILLWRYGTTYSIHVHSSIFNPWCCQFFGNLAMGIGQCLPSPNMYYISSMVGFLLLLWSVLALMKEITQDLLAEENFEDFLKDVARMGNAHSVTTKVMIMKRLSQQPNQQQQQKNHNLESNFDVEDLPPPPPPPPLTPSLSPSRLHSDWEEDVTLQQVLHDVEAACHRINKDHVTNSSPNRRLRQTI
jgi:hypothetical protein